MIALFLIAFALAATVLAIWIDVRFEDRRPGDIYRAMLLIGVSWLVARFIVRPGMYAVGATGHPIAAIVVVALPATVFCLLTGIWLVRVCAGMLQRGLYN